MKKLELTDTERMLAELALGNYQAAKALAETHLVRRLAPLRAAHGLAEMVLITWSNDSGQLEGFVDRDPVDPTIPQKPTSVTEFPHTPKLGLTKTSRGGAAR